MSISVEWALAGGQAVAVEPREDRIATIHRNAQDFGLDHRIRVVHAKAMDALDTLPQPQAVFVGGGASAALFDVLFDRLAPGVRLVANGVTLETDALLSQLQADRGGDLMRIETAQAEPLGSLRSWSTARPITQWRITL